MFSCKYCEIFQNICFYRTPPLTASALNVTLYFWVVNLGCTIWSCQLLLTRKDFNFNWLWLIKLIWWNRTRPKPFGNLGIGISASASALTSASASALQKKICLAKFLFCLSKFLIKKKSMVKSFSSTLVHHPGSFSRCLGESFCRNQVSTCFWRKELTVDVYGGLEVP